MKLEKIIIELNKYLECEDIVIIEQLKQDLEEQLRKETAYKTTSKSRVNAIAKMQKYNTKHVRENLNGYAKNNEQFIFTNSYYLVSINDSLGYEDNNRNFSSLLNTFDRIISEDNKIELDYNNIMSSYKLKEKFYNIQGINFDSEYLKQFIDILGNDLTVYLDKKDLILYVENKENEKGVLLGCKTY